MRDAGGLWVHRLAEYLGHVGFAAVCKHVEPTAVRSGAAVRDEDGYISGMLDAAARDPAFRLAACLAADVPTPVAEMGLEHRELSEALVAAGLLLRDGGVLRAGPDRLVVVAGRPMLLPKDAALRELRFLAFYVDAEGAAGTLVVGADALGVALDLPGPIQVLDASSEQRERVAWNAVLAGRAGEVTADASTDRVHSQIVALALAEPVEDVLARAAGLLHSEGTVTVVGWLPGDATGPLAPRAEGLALDLFVEQGSSDGRWLTAVVARRSSSPSVRVFNPYALSHAAVR